VTFTPEERSRVRERLLELARADGEIVAAAILGSHVAGREDRWSDVDLSLAVAEGATVAASLAKWTAIVEREFGVVHHFDLRKRSTVYRVFLLPNGLQVDLSFTPAAEFASYGPNWRTVFGSAQSREPSPPPPLDELVGYGWLYLLHVRVAVERGKLLQAEHFLSALRSRTLELACIRHGLRWQYGRGFDGLPAAATAWVDGSLARSLDPGELRRALRLAAEAFLDEVEAASPELHQRLAPPLRLLTAG
jgi:predicted nucleotidyltransferase